MYCLLMILVPLNAPANAPDSTVVGFPRGFDLVTEVGFYYGTGSGWLSENFVAWELGPIYRFENRRGLAGSLFFAANNEVWQLGWKIRIRRCFDHEIFRHVEIAVGTVFETGGSDPGVKKVELPMFIAHGQVGLLDWLALAAQVQITNPPELDYSIWGSGSEGNMNFHLGIKARERPALWLAVPVFLLLAAGSNPF